MIMLSDKIDYGNTSAYTWTSIAMPAYFVVGYYIFYLIVCYFKDKDESKSLVKLAVNIVGYLFVFTSLLMFFLNKSKELTVPEYVPTSLLLIAGFLIFLDKILKCAFESESN
jgi:uncharacterized membrane protein